jgi:hypothetical protein
MGMLEKLREAIDELAAIDPASLSSREDVLELHRQRDRLDAVVTRSLAAFDASKDWMPSRARSAAYWLAWKHHMPVSTAKRELKAGRALRSMPIAESAWLDGEIGAPHVTQLAKATVRPDPAEAFARDEKLLVDDAKTLSYSGFYRAVQYWISLADPDGVEDDAEHQRDKRTVHLSQSFDDMWFGEMVFDPVSGAIVSAELKRLEQELFLADWAEAKARLGHEPGILDIGRSPQQRRADALLEMAIRSRTAPPDGRRPEPLFSVFVDYETFAGRICELANGTVVSPGSLVPWLDRAWVERIVFEGPSRVKDVGVHRRLFEGATRRAVEVRDRECFHPSCDERVDDCQIDHIEPYSWGGPTTVDNGRVACGPHNRARHRRSEPPTP